MALRKFNDATGREWEVWETFPSAAPERTALDRYLTNQASAGGARPVAVRPQFANGWLTFVHRTERRRLAPIPDNWASADEARLRTYLSNSAVSPSTSRRLGER